MSNEYEVYVAKSIKGEPLYVGQGLRGRHLHCLSGFSHSKLLNRYYFNNGEDSSMKVEVLKDGLSKQEALEEERRLISVLNPKFNIVGKIPAVRAVNFESNYAPLSVLRNYLNLYHGYFKGLANLSDSEMIDVVANHNNVAKQMVESGDVYKMIRLCGNKCFNKCPLIIKHNGEWVLNESANNLFDSTPDEIRCLF